MLPAVHAPDSALLRDESNVDKICVRSLDEFTILRKFNRAKALVNKNRAETERELSKSRSDSSLAVSRYIVRMREGHEDRTVSSYVGRTVPARNGSGPIHVGANANPLSKYLNADTLINHAEDMSVSRFSVRRVLKLDDDISHRSYERSPLDPVFSIWIRKTPGEKWGITVHSAEGKSVMCITAIESGPITAWNAKHPNLRVRVADRVEEVNGITGNFNDLCDAFKRNTVQLSARICCANDDPTQKTTKPITAKEKRRSKWWRKPREEAAEVRQCVEEEVVL